MNSEELEQSLRTEFESYLKEILADMKQEVADFQEKFQSEFDRQKAQLDEVFQTFSSRINSDRQLDAAFKDSVVEHLRLARDEGARITATAIAQAEEMQRESDAQIVVEAPVANYSELRDAVQDISEKDSQSAILKALVNHAAQFTPRGAFFIIKNEHLVGWRVFGEEGNVDEQTVREVFFPVASNTVLGESVRSLSAVESSHGTYAEDLLFLDKLEFGQPEKMYAIPLVARNRGVAVLYADHGNGGEKVNIEALETLVRVAGLTVELLAASQTVKPRVESSAPAAYAEETISAPPAEKEEKAESAPEYQAAANDDFDEKSEKEEFAQTGGVDQFEAETPKSEESESEPEKDTSEFQTFASPSNFADEKVAEVAENEYQPTYGDNFQTLKPENDEAEKVAETETPAEEAFPSYSWSQPIDDSERYAEKVETSNYSAAETPNNKDFAAETTGEMTDYGSENNYPVSNTDEFKFTPQNSYDFSTESTNAAEEKTDYEKSEIQSPQFESTYNAWDSGAVEAPKFEAPKFESSEEFTTEKFAASYETFSAAAPPAEPVTETVAATTAKSRLSERNVDLPIEVAEDERRSHNDARRFARLLVSEIKLYNEQKVKEGREMNDLYERLREAIDRSREMYDKRVQPPVAAKFDYFHYELVNNLAEGEESRLGTSYQGATT